MKDWMPASPGFEPGSTGCQSKILNHFATVLPHLSFNEPWLSDAIPICRNFPCRNLPCRNFPTAATYLVPEFAVPELSYCRNFPYRKMSAAIFFCRNLPWRNLPCLNLPCRNLPRTLFGSAFQLFSLYLFDKNNFFSVLYCCGETCANSESRFFWGRTRNEHYLP